MTTTTRAQPHLSEIALPDFGMPEAEPLLPPGLYAERLKRLRSAMDARGYDHVIVWGDREHSANLAYLSGFDPRFEEALLIVGPTGDPAVLVGNECEGMAAAAPLPMRVVIPAYVISELKTGFQMGFFLFVPFMLIDLVVSTTLLSMGMMQLPPAMVSLPFKVLLFVMVDGWNLLVGSIVRSFD